MDCLHAALNASISPKSRDILVRLIGDKQVWHEDWKSSDKPDLCRVIGDTVIGVEQFSVDKFFVAKKKGFQSLAAMHQAMASDMVKKYVGKDTSLIDCQQVLSEISSFATDKFVYERQLGDRHVYTGLLYGLFGSDKNGGHAQKVDTVYRENLARNYPGKTIQVGFLIEYTGDFSSLVYSDLSGLHQNEAAVLPLSYFLLSMLRNVFECGADFIILYRKRLAQNGISVFAEKTLVLDRDFLNYQGQSFLHGECVYCGLYGDWSRNANFDIQSYLKTPDSESEYFLGQRVSVKQTVNTDWYWLMVLVGLTRVEQKDFVFADVELMATICALFHTPHEWHRDLSGWPRPYNFDVRTFAQQRGQFLRRFSNVSLQDIQNAYKHVDFSNPVWIPIKSKDGKEKRKRGGHKL